MHKLFILHDQVMYKMVIIKQKQNKKNEQINKRKYIRNDTKNHRLKGSLIQTHIF